MFMNLLKLTDVNFTGIFIELIVYLLVFNHTITERMYLRKLYWGFEMNTYRKCIRNVFGASVIYSSLPLLKCTLIHPYYRMRSVVPR